MTHKKVIIIGASEHAKVIIDIFEKQNTHHIIGLVDKSVPKGVQLLGYPVLGTEQDLPALWAQHQDFQLFIAVGDNWVRHLVKEKIDQLLPQAGYTSAIHPSAQIGKNVHIGLGVAIMAGAIVNPDSQVQDFSIINTKASLDHDCILGPFASLAPNVSTGGKVQIGAFTAISIGASIIHGINIGSHALIGAGAVLLQHCPNNSLMYGIPAKHIRTRHIGEKYL